VGGCDYGIRGMLLYIELCMRELLLSILATWPAGFGFEIST